MKRTSGSISLISTQAHPIFRNATSKIPRMLGILGFVLHADSFNKIRMAATLGLLVFFSLVLPISAIAAGTWNTRAPYPVSATTDASAQAVGNKIYVVGGWDVVTGLSTDRLEIYDSTTDTWTTGTPMPTKRMDVVTGVIGGKLYVAGGFSPTSFTQIYRDTLEIYDPATNTWSTGAPMPAPRGLAMGGVIGGKLYVVGGASGCCPSTAYADLFVYDPATNIWVTKAPMASGTRFFGGAGVVNGKLYVAGGETWPSSPFVARLEEYDPTSDTWTTKAPMPATNGSFAGAAINNKFYVVGGRFGSTSRNSVWAYDPALDSWSVGTTLMPTARGDYASAVLLNKLHVIGGNKGLARTNIHEVFTPAGASAPVFSTASFSGGAGDQRGTGVAINGGNAFISGQSLAGHGLGVSYSLPPVVAPTWSILWPAAPSPWPTVEVFGGVALTNEGVYFPGYSMAQTTDGVGGKEEKSVLVKYPLNGPTGPGEAGSLLAAKPHFFSYTGSERFDAATTVIESGTPFVYSVGGGQPCSHFAYDIAKFDTAGNLIASATDSSVGISFGACFVPSTGGSHAFDVTELNGNIYAAGGSGWASDGGTTSRATVWKYDSNLNLIWRSKEGTGALNHQLHGATSLGNAIYGVGMEWGSTAGSEDYLVVKYDELGNIIWSKTSGGANTDVLNGIVAVGSKLFAVGYTKSSGSGGADAVILEIDPATGNTLSTTLYGGALDDMANGVATDGTDLYVVGESKSFANGGNAVGQNDVMLLHYTLTGSTPANHPPAANAGAPQTVECTGASSANMTLNGSASSDPDGDALTYAWAWTGGSATGVNPSASFPLGTTTVTLTVDDGNGHTATAATSVTVQDTTPPTVNAGADVTVEATSTAGAAYNVAAQATATDTCCPVSTNIAPAGIYPLGATTVTVNATDCAGNTGSDQMIVTVQDSTVPVITAPPAVTAEATGPQTSVSTGTATATDIFAVTISSNAPATFPVGTTVVTWTATDANGNVSTATQNVTVTDTTAPVVTAPTNITVDATGLSTPVLLGVASASDLVDGVLTATLDLAGPFSVGSHTITWSATDAHGNTGTATQTVTVNEVNTVPNLPLPGGVSASISVPAGHTLFNAGGGAALGGPAGISFPFDAIGFSVSTTVGGSVMINITFSSPLPTPMLLWKYDGVSSYQPIPSALWSVTGPNSIAVALTDGGPFDLDGVANGIIVDPIAIAVDTKAPLITLNGANPMTLAQGAPFTDPGATVTDNVDTGLVATVTGAVNTAVAGTYTLTYSATDAAGNTATAIRTVTVTASPPPPPPGPGQDIDDGDDAGHHDGLEVENEHEDKDHDKGIKEKEKKSEKHHKHDKDD